MNNCINFKKRIFAILLVLILIFLSGCETYDAFHERFFEEQDETTIKFLVFEPLTGEFATQGEYEKLGIEIANELYPTVIGKKIEIIYVDHEGDITAIEERLSEIKANTQSVIFGSYGEAFTLYLGRHIKKIKVPAFSITSINYLITKSNEYFFTTTYTSDNVGNTLANFSYNEKGNRKSAVISIKDDESTLNMCNQYIEKYDSLIVDDSSYKTKKYEIGLEDTEFYELLLLLKEEGVESIFLPLANSVSYEIIREATMMGYKPLFLGTRQMAIDENFLNRVKLLDAEICFCDEDINISESDIGIKFSEKYREHTQSMEEPPSQVAVAFDAYMLSLKAIENAYLEVEKTEREEFVKDFTDQDIINDYLNSYDETKKNGVPSSLLIKDAILKIKDFQGLSGLITYDGSNIATKGVTLTHMIGKDEIQVVTDNSALSFSEKLEDIDEVIENEGEN